MRNNHPVSATLMNIHDSFRIRRRGEWLEGRRDRGMGSGRGRDEGGAFDPSSNERMNVELSAGSFRITRNRKSGSLGKCVSKVLGQFSDSRTSCTRSMFYKRHPIRDIVLILERLRDIL